MRILERRSVPKPEGDPNFHSACFPAIERLPSGRWIATFRAARTKGDCALQQAAISRSDDRGRTWTQPVAAVRLPTVDGRPGHSRTAYCVALGGDRVLLVCNWVDASEPLQPYFNPADESLKDTRIFFCFSDDAGESWSAPELLDTGPIHGPVPLTGPPLRLRDGTLACQFEVNKAASDPAKWVHQSALVFSRDGGRTWGEPTLVTNNPDIFYWDQRPAVMADGTTILDFFWTFDARRGRYCNIHAAASPDGGRTWEEPWDTGIYGQPGQPVDLGDGRIATIDIDRSSNPVITVRLGRDLGRVQTAALPIYTTGQGAQDSRSVRMNQAWHEMARFSVGHPNLLDLGDGEVLAFFYAGPNPDNTRIELVRIAV